MRYRYLLYILLLLPAFAFRDYTPSNELKYISIVEEALRNNTWFTFYNHGEAYADKPPLYFWLLMLSRLITGDYHMWLMGLFSLIPAAGVMAVMDKWYRDENVRHNPLVSNLLLGTTAIFLASSIVLRMDMLMTFFIVMSLYTFFRIYKGRNSRAEKWLLPVYVFLAIFSKGALGFLIPVVSIAVFLLLKKEIRRFGSFFGWAQWGVLLALCAVWFLIVYMEGGSGYLNNILFKQTVGRGIDSFHHKRPFYYYLLHSLYTFAPWVLMYMVLMWQGIWKRVITGDTEKFFLTIIWVNFLMLSLISSKLQIYLLPVYPFVAYLASTLLVRFGKTSAVKITAAIPVAVFALLFPASFFLPRMLSLEYDSLVMFRTGLFILSAASVAALLYIRRNRIGNALVLACGGLLLMFFTASFGLPQFNRYMGLGTIAAQAENEARSEGILHYAYYKFSAASNMDVYLGVQPERIGSVAQLDSLDNAGGKTILFVRDSELRREEELRNWIESRGERGRTGNYSWYIVGGRPEEQAVSESKESSL